MHLSRPEILLYMDESGSRDPDRHPREQADSPDWFGIGGVLVKATDKAGIETAMDDFRLRWPQMGEHPFRSYDIRNKTGRFRWLSQIDETSLTAFYDDLSAMIASLPIVVTGCVIHRPGYNERYLEQYGIRRGKFCKTAKNGGFELLLPFSKEAEQLSHDIDLAQFLAQQVLIAASSPLQP